MIFENAPSDGEDVNHIAYYYVIAQADRAAYSDLRGQNETAQAIGNEIEDLEDRELELREANQSIDEEESLTWEEEPNIVSAGIFTAGAFNSVEERLERRKDKSRDEKKEIFNFSRSAISQAKEIKVEVKRDSSIGVTLPSIFSTTHILEPPRLAQTTTGEFFQVYELPGYRNNCGLAGIYGREIDRPEVRQQLLAVSSDEYIRALMAIDIVTYISNEIAMLPVWLQRRVKAEGLENLEQLRERILENEAFRREFFQSEGMFREYVINVIGAENRPMIMYDSYSNRGAMAAIAALNHVSLDIYQEFEQVDMSRLLVRRFSYRASQAQASAPLISLLHMSQDVENPINLNHFRLLVSQNIPQNKSSRQPSLIHQEKGSLEIKNSKSKNASEDIRNSDQDSSRQESPSLSSNTRQTSNLKSTSLDLSDSPNLKSLIRYISNQPLEEVQNSLSRRYGINALNVLGIDGESPLTKVVTSGDYDSVKILLKMEGINVNIANLEGNTPLMVAAREGRTDIVKMLLERPEIHLNARNNEGSTALRLAERANVKNSRRIIIQALKETIQLRRDDILQAAQENEVEYLQSLLLMLGSDIDINFAGPEYEHQTLLMHAARLGHIKIVAILLKIVNINVNAKSPEGLTASVCASRNYHREIAQLINEFNDTRTLKLRSDLFAIPKYPLEVIKDLINIPGIGVNANALYEDMTVLMSAARNGDTELFKLLLEIEELNKDVVNNQGQTVLVIAAINNYPDIVDLLKEGASMQLYQAAENGYIESVRALLTVKDVDVNTRGQSSNSPLTVAASKGHIDVVKFLLEEKKIDLNLMDCHGMSALMLAAMYGYVDIVKALLEVKPRPIPIHVNIADKEGRRTALMLAAENGHAEAIKELLNVEEIDFNAVDRQGKTALMLAAENGHAGAVKALLKDRRIDFNQCNKAGETARMLAEKKGHVEIVKVISNHYLTIIMDSKNTGDVNKVKILISSDLLYAASTGDEWRVKTLVFNEPELDINTTDNGGNTALMLAAWHGHERVVKCLLNSSTNVNVNAIDNNGVTARTKAEWKNNTSIINLLNKAGAAEPTFNNKVIYPIIRVEKMPVQKGSRITPLIDALKVTELHRELERAIRDGDINKVQKLLKDPNLDINATDGHGRTALIWATIRKKTEIVELLLKVPTLLLYLLI